MEQLKRELRERYISTYNECKKFGYKPRIFLDMTVSNRDIVETTRKLIHKPTTGFSTLHKKGRMDLSVEKIILEPKFRELFARADLQAAYNSLKERGYPQLDQIEAP